MANRVTLSFSIFDVKIYCTNTTVKTSSTRFFIHFRFKVVLVFTLSSILGIVIVKLIYVKRKYQL